MRKKIFIGLAASLLLGNLAFGQVKYWSTENVANRVGYESFVVKFDMQQVKQELQRAGHDRSTAVTMFLPTPNGGSMVFEVWKNNLLPNDLQEKYSEISSYTAVNIKDERVTAKIDLGTNGFHAMVLGSGETYFINPIGNNTYSVFYKENFKAVANSVICDFDNQPELVNGAQPVDITTGTAQRTNGISRRTYRLALSNTGEYAVAAVGANPTKAAVLSAMTTTMNRVNGIYEKELAVTMVFIPNMDTLIYLDPATDPFSANNNGGALLGQNQSNVATIIGSANYDIGHIFSTGGGGIAALGSVCVGAHKAKGVTGSINPIGDPFDVDYVAHEMGHQFGANHTFNKCSGTENAPTALEPGSGSTIMAYAGICGQTNNLQAHSDAYFHFASLNEIFYNLGLGPASQCGTVTTGISIPQYNVSLPEYNIPKKTAFEFEFPQVTPGNDSSAITYNIEQANLGDFRQNENLSASFRYGPSLRSFSPDTTRLRTFLRMNSLLSGFLERKGERLSDTARTYYFAYTAREVKDGWGAVNVHEDRSQINVIQTPRHFSVIYPNLQDSVLRNAPATIMWDQAYTGSAPIHCSAVDIFLSIDNGENFEMVAQNLPNNGLATVMMPDTAVNTARIKIKASNNIFFAISGRVVIGGSATIPPPFDTTTPPPIGINDLSAEEGIAVYPNPAKDFITVSLGKEAKNGQILIYNVLGQAVYSEAISISQKTKRIPLTNMANGLYYVRFVNVDGKQFSQSIVIQK